jgi:DNA-binding NarL/FixJ family response regulator
MTEIEGRSVHICEDHDIVYVGLKLLLEKSTSYQLVGYSQNGKDLIYLLNQHQPDILILDLNLPGTDGFSLLKSVREVDKKICVVILTMYQDEFLVERARQEGANAYLLKNATNDELLKALNAVTSNTFYMTPQLKRELAKKKLFLDSFPQKMKLTRRELEIIRLISSGKNSQQISIDLEISQHTVETHRKNILRKLEINNLTALIKFAHDNKII